MSTQQLGKIGLVFLAIYLVVSSLSGIPLAMGQMWSFRVPNATGAVTTIVFMLLSVVLFALLPALLIISQRDRLAKALFLDDRDSQISVEPQTLLAVGLVLMGVSTLIAGLVRAVAVSTMAVSTTIAGTATIAAGSFVAAVVQIVLGVAPIRGSNPPPSRFRRIGASG